MLEASIEPPEVAPAPITVWISSINKIFSLLMLALSKDYLVFLQNLPYILFLLTRVDISKQYTLVFNNTLGTFFLLFS